MVYDNNSDIIMEKENITNIRSEKNIIVIS